MNKDKVLQLENKLKEVITDFENKNNGFKIVNIKYKRFEYEANRNALMSTLERNVKITLEVIN